MHATDKMTGNIAYKSKAQKSEILAEEAKSNATIMPDRINDRTRCQFHVALDDLKNRFRHQRNPIETDARRILDRIQNRRPRAVHR